MPKRTIFEAGTAFMERICLVFNKKEAIIEHYVKI